MKNKKLVVALAVFGIVSGVISLIFRSRIFDFDRAIIIHGYRAVRGYRNMSNIFAIAAVLLIAAAVCLSFFLRNSQKKSHKMTLLEESSEEFEEGIIIQRLSMLAKNNESAQIASSAELTISQIKQINNLINRYESLYIDQNVDVFDRVGKSIRNGKQHIIQNAKSIINRITVEGCKDEVKKKLNKNAKLIDDVKVLLNETVNYLDNKSTTSSNPLLSITSSLQILNETIKEDD